DAVDRIRKSPGQVRYNLYVVDRGGRLVGVLNLRELLLAERKQTLGEIARRDVLSVPSTATRSLILGHPAWREAHSLPVVDREGTYLGAIRYRTWRLLEEEAQQNRARRDTTTSDALGDLLATGVAGAVGAFTDLASRATHVRSDDDG
ncbi:MAG: CBS domain-containing protein, partial [Gemmatimonadetes bacterium]|nr:CBS domain-containing protein [Gemmatimonadota bacterium]